MFRIMASAHEAWIHELFGDLSKRQVAGLLDELETLKRSVAGVVHATEADRS